jgi:hypothetical protein
MTIKFLHIAIYQLIYGQIPTYNHHFIDIKNLSFSVEISKKKLPSNTTNKILTQVIHFLTIGG